MQVRTVHPTTAPQPRPSSMATARSSSPLVSQRSPLSAPAPLDPVSNRDPDQGYLDVDAELELDDGSVTLDTSPRKPAVDNLGRTDSMMSGPRSR
jgi:hypothetical protein